MKGDHLPRHPGGDAEVIRRRFISTTPQLRCGINAHALLWLARPDASAAPQHRPRIAEPLAAAAASATRLFAWDPYRLHSGKRGPTWYAFGVASGRLVTLGPVAAATLAACDGTTTAAEVLAPLTPNERRRVRRALARLAEAGLVAVAEPDPRRGPLRVALERDVRDVGGRDAERAARARHAEGGEPDADLPSGESVPRIC